VLESSRIQPVITLFVNNRGPHSSPAALAYCFGDDSGRVSHKLSAKGLSRKWRFQEGEIIRLSSCRLHSLVMCDNFTQWLMHTRPPQEVPENRGGIFCMGAQTRTDILPYMSLIPVFGYFMRGTSTNNLAPAARFLKSSQAAPLTPSHCGLRVALRGSLCGSYRPWAREETTNLRNFAGDQHSTFGRHWALEWGMLCKLL